MNFKELIPLNRKSGPALYLQISTGISDAIEKGILPPGTKLPGVQKMAQELGVFKRTIEQAYEELNSQDWIRVKPYSGTYIAAQLPIKKLKHLQTGQHSFPNIAAFKFQQIGFKNPISPYFTIRPCAKIVFDDGNPDIAQMAAVVLDKYYRQLLEKQHPNSSISKMSPWGNTDLRRNLCTYLNSTRGLRATLENILIAKGNQLSIFLILSLLLKPGDGFAYAAANYKGIADMGQYLHATIHPLPSDDEGILPDALEKECQSGSIKVVYIMPHAHYPTTEKLAPDRRIRILELADRYDFVIIEDDHDFDYQYSGIAAMPMASADQKGRVIYVGGLNRCMSTAVRVSYIVGPSDFLTELVKLKVTIDKFTDPVLEEALALLIQRKEFIRYLKKANKFYQNRRDYICKLIGKKLSQYCTLKVPESGLAVWLRFQEQVDLNKLTAACLDEGLSLPYVEELYVQPPYANGLRIGFSSVTNEDIYHGICILEKTLRKLYPQG